MGLTLSIRGAETLDNGAPGRIVLDRRGALIGRATTSDWSLPDPQRFISSRHCEVTFLGGQYVLTDCSTNGTLVNGTRPAGPHVLQDGDVVTIGPYEVEAALSGGSEPSPASAPAAAPGWGDWNSHIPAEPVGVDPASWDRAPARAAISGMGPMADQWAPPTASGPAPAPASGWGPAPTPSAGPPVDPPGHGSWGAPPADAWQESPERGQWGPAPSPSVGPAAASAWASADPTPAPASGNDIWGQFEAANSVDWSRSGFGIAPAPPPASARLGMAIGAEFAPAPTPPPEPVAQPAPSPSPAPSPPPPRSDDAYGALLAGAGLDAQRISANQVMAAGIAGQLLRRLVAGLVVLLEARARAKGQMGATSTMLELAGNNPIKFARTPDQALLQLLNPPERGFMDPLQAVEDSFHDLQSHQLATLKAMQGALRATLDQFSPPAIRKRAETGGLLARILPTARDAALWQAYEKEFSGVVAGSDERFMDVFAQEFRKAYEAQAGQRSGR